MRYTPPATFAALVPWLILFAVVLFALQEPIQRWLRKGTPVIAEATTAKNWLPLAVGAQFLTGIAARYWREPERNGLWASKQRREFQTLIHEQHLGRAFRVLLQVR